MNISLKQILLFLPHKMNQHLNQPHMFGGSRPPHHHHMQLQHKKPFIPMVNKKYIFKNIKFQGINIKFYNFIKITIQFIVVSKTF